jgi:16S rRNA (cytosine1402-N4)-methyltransferase
MTAEVLDGLAVRSGATFVDGTVGSGGHAAAVLEASAPDGRLLGIDLDREAVERARMALAHLGSRAVLVRGTYGDLARLAERHGFAPADGVILDLGLSSDQLADPERGFSFQETGPLDMRFDLAADTTAADLVNGLDERALADVLYTFGEEHRSRRIARAIVQARPLSTTADLCRAVERAVGARRGRRHPATRTFQALRIAVNSELATLTGALPRAIDLLAPGGRLVVLTYHSLEDRAVKVAFRQAASNCVCPPGTPECRCDHHATVRLITRRPIRPTDAEVESNRRSRSARLRVVERLPDPEAGRRHWERRP